MLGIDVRAVRVAWTVFVFALLVWIVYLIREEILIFVAALFLAYVLSPLVDIVSGRMQLSRTVALSLVFLVGLGLVGGGGAYLGTRAVQEGTQLAQQLPELIQKHQNVANLPVPEWLEPYRERAFDAVRNPERIIPLIQTAVGGIVGLLGSLGFLILVPVLSFFFLKDAGQIRESIVGWVSDDHRAVTQEILQDVHVLLGQYIRALIVLSVVTSVVYLAFFEAIGLPYAVLLSVLAAPLEFIPFIGPLLGTVIVLLVAIFTGYPHVWWILVFFAIHRVFQDYVLQPYLMSQGIELHPLMVIFGALAGQQLGGLWGMFLSVPILATLRIVLIRMQRRQKARSVAA